MKDHKFKPLIELYNHGDSLPLFNPKVDSKFVNKCVKNLTSEKFVKAKYCEGNTCALSCTPCDPVLRVPSEMEKNSVHLSEIIVQKVTVDQAPLADLYLDRKVGNQTQLPSGKITSHPCPGSCPNSNPEYARNLNSSKASSVPEDLKMLENVKTSQSEVEHNSQDVFDHHDNNSCCVSKESVVVTATSDYIGGADPTIVTASAASVNSVCLGVMERSLNDLSTPTVSLSDPHSVGGEDNRSFRAQKNSNEALLTTVDSSDRSVSAETSVGMDGHDGAITEKCVTFGCRKEQVDLLVTKMTDSSVAQGNHELLRPETGFSDTNLEPADLPRTSDGDDSLKFNTPAANTQEPLSQSQTIIHGAGSEELVDVRVCDICGDGGREALLALCSMCSDGAEHIYCMRNKMDRVPESGWMCEDCIGMQELKGHCQIVAEIGTALTPLCREELTKPLPRLSSGVQQADKMSSKHFRGALSLSGKRPGPCIEMRSAPKKKMLEESIHPPKSPCNGTKTRLTRVSSVNNIHKGKSAAPKGSSFNNRPAKRVFDQAFPSGCRSPKPEKRLCKESFDKSKTGDMSELKVQVSKDDVLSRVDATKESPHSNVDKVSNKRLHKSLSIAGLVPPDEISCNYNLKGVKVDCGRDLTKKVCVPEKKTNRLGSLSTSNWLRVRSSRTKVVSKTAIAVPILDKKANVSGNIEVRKSRPLAQNGGKHENTLAKSVGGKLASDRPSCAIGCLVKDVNSYPVHKGSHRNLNAKVNNTSKNKNHHELHPEKNMPLLAPAKGVVPAAECVWKGGFKLERGGKLQNYSSGIQAHLSTCASSKVHDVVSKFGPRLILKEVARSETWPPHFRSYDPTEQDIALYFFAEDLKSYERSFKKLLDNMMEKDLVLEASLDEVQLLVLPSNLLPVKSQRWNSLFFLWGVCRVRKADHRSIRLPSLDVETLNKEIGAPVTYGSMDKCVPVLGAGSSSASQTSHNSILEPDAVDSLLLLSSALSKSSDQIHTHDESSTKCLGAQEDNDMYPDKIQTVHDLKDDSLLCRVLPTGNMLNGSQSEDRHITHISKVATFPSVQSNGEHIVSSVMNGRGSDVHSDRSGRGFSVPWAYYNCASEFCSRQDIASRSSFSIESGPSASSDGCAKSDEVHGDQSLRPSTSRSLNLDLCLGFSSGPEEQVDLDLVLGFPSEHQPKHCTKSTNTQNMNISPFLSLGMSCSNA